jgi:hypothetical protein
MSSIAALAHKAPVIATFDTHMLHTAAQEVHLSYKWHAATYVEQPDLVGLRERFVEAIQQAKTPKACLSGPFGYGKTASAIGLWSACQQAGLLAVPPISCSSFAELAQVVYDWFVFTLPEKYDDITQAYQNFLTVTADSMARRDEREFGIPFEKASAAIRDKLERGYLDFEDVSVNLVAFLAQATELAQNGGYQGLVVIIDEIQQLVGNANKGILVALRQLVWGLRMRQIPFGLLITMDPDTERTLADRAGDILHRIKDDGLFLDIRHIYDREFPAKLWIQYSKAFDLGNDAQLVIDHPALESLGQMCERDDLSNGPRTVINVLQLAAERSIMSESAIYTPLILIDDFLSGAIRFDGDRSIVPVLVAELLSFPYFQRSGELSQALKLLAAFPRGCSRQIAARYGLAGALDKINDDLRGEFVTELDEGLTLVELQRVGRPANRLNILLRRYWMQITDQQLFAENAPQIFVTYVLPLIFQSKTHDLKGWSGVDNIKLSASGVYTGIIEGTSSTSYPLRRVAVYVLAAGADAPLEPETNDTDLTMIFRLDLRSDAISSIEQLTNDRVVFNLAPGQPSNVGLSGSLAWIAHYLSPHTISAAVVLSLLKYLTQEQDDTLSERDKARMDDTIARLQEWFLTEVFPQDMFRSAGFEVSYAGEGAIKEFLHMIFAQRWNNYQPLARYQQWATLMREYETALERVAPAVKVGEIPERGTKGAIANLFDQTRHAGFESRARQYEPLLKIETWRGREATIRFVAHPAELLLAQWVRTAGSLSRQVAYHQLRAQGFASAEVEHILYLALIRGLVAQNEADLTVPEIPADVELLARAKELKVRCESHWDTSGALRTQLEEVLDTGAQLENPDEISWQLNQIEMAIEKIEVQKRTDTETRKKNLHRQLLDVQSDLALPLPYASPGMLKNHLEAVCNKFAGEQQRLSVATEDLIGHQKVFSIDKAEEVLAKVAQWKDKAELYNRWNSMAQRLTHLRQAVERLQIDTNTLPEVHTCIEKITSDARADLATEGVTGLVVIGKFETSLSRCEQEFQSMSRERQQAYDHVAHNLFAEVQNLFHLSVCPAPPPYNPENDEQSFQKLLQSTAALVERYITILSIQVAGTEDTKQKQRLRAKLRKDILALAQKASDTEWLIKGSPPHLYKEAVKKIRSLQEQIEREFPEQARQESPRLQLVQALSILPPGTHDVKAITDQINGTCDHEELLHDLLYLYKIGSLRLMIDLHQATKE